VNKRRLEQIIKSTPIDRSARLVVSEGVSWDPVLNPQMVRSETFMPFRAPVPGPTNIAGQRFGRLVVKGLTRESVNKNGAKWVCRCDCGAFERRAARSLQAGTANMCLKCYRLEEMKAGRGPAKPQRTN
jgi:hypothetical protein